MESYPFPDFVDVPFDAWTWSAKKKRAESKSTVLVTSSPGDNNTAFVVRNLTFNYRAKPVNLPMEKTKNREGNRYSRGAYEAWEGIELAAHVPAEWAADASVQAAHTRYVNTATTYLWDARKDVFPRSPPKTKADLSILRFAYANILTSLSAPRSAPAGASTTGIVGTIVGWGHTIDRAVVLKTGNPKMPERVAYSDFAPLPAETGVPEEFHTRFWMLMETPKGPTFIGEVPWTEDGLIGTGSPVRTDEATGEDLWRRVGPQDILPGSKGDAVYRHKNLIASDGTGNVNKTIVVEAVYFSRPQKSAKVEEEDSEHVSIAMAAAPPAGLIASREATKALLEAAKHEEEESTVPVLPFSAASKPAPITPHNPTHPKTTTGTAEHALAGKRGRAEKQLF